MLKKAFYIMAKDLRIEFRQKEMLSSMLIFALLVVILSGWAFDTMTNNIAVFYPGLLWIIFIFAALLGVGRAFSSEKADGALTGLVMAPVDRLAIYLAKLGENLILLGIVELIVVPVSVGILNYRFHGSIPGLILAIILGDLGFSGLATFLSALAMNTRMNDLLLPVILFPLLIPAVIGSVEATTQALASPVFKLNAWHGLLLAYDFIFLALAVLLFEYLLEV